MTARQGKQMASELLGARVTAEAAMLGAALVEREARDAVLGAFAPDELCHPRHSHILRAMAEDANDGEASDFVTVTARLMAAGVFDDCGGHPYLMELSDAAPTAAKVAHYIALARDYAAKARLRLIGVGLAEASANGRPAAEIVAELRASLDTLDTHTATPGFAPTLAEAVKETRAIDWLPVLSVEVGLVARALFTLLSGLPKAGKSTLLTWLIGQWIALGLRVLLLSEEPPDLLDDRCRELEIPRDRLRVEFTRGRTLADVTPALRTVKTDICIIDSFRGWQALGDENVPERALANVSPILDWARAGRVALIGTHFLRKSGGDEGMAHAGTTALVGLSDVAVELYRDRVPNRRRLRTVSRSSLTPADLLLELREGNYAVIGTASAVAKAEVEARILEVLARNDDPLTREELRELVEDPRPSDGQMSEALTRLWARGDVKHIGKGKRGDPYRYFRP
jgi:hypothetical protein